ncbi:MAG: hypothetical protein NC299_11900 [Lachnospiraceae bacterium]|nr:hypothetical protein [Lachnospiraceae bacterium]
MEIIKNGDLNRLKRTIRFECNKCGCIFKANTDECTAEQQYNDVYFYCGCPCCGARVYETEIS